MAELHRANDASATHVPEDVLGAGVACAGRFLAAIDDCEAVVEHRVFDEVARGERVMELRDATRVDAEAVLCGPPSSTHAARHSRSRRSPSSG